MLLSEEIRGFFTAAGWTPGARRPSPHRSHAYAANPHAFAVLAEYGGLHVGTCGPGRDCAASDVQFWDAPNWQSAELVRRWVPELGLLAGIASAHHEHIVVYVAADGRYYLFSVPDGKLYVGGADFSEAMERLLLGISYGNAL